MKSQRWPASPLECRRNRVRCSHCKPFPAGNSWIEPTIERKMWFSPPQALCTGGRLFRCYLEPVAKRLGTVVEQQNQMAFTVQLRAINWRFCLKCKTNLSEKILSSCSCSETELRPQRSCSLGWSPNCLCNFDPSSCQSCPRSLCFRFRLKIGFMKVNFFSILA